MAAGMLLTLLVLAKVGFNPGELFTRAAANHEAKDGYLHPGLQFPTQLGMLSFGIAFVLGTAGLPHILVRFFTVPDAKAARGSVGWAVFLIGAFYLMVMVVGVGARAILGQAGEEAAGKGGNLAIPTLAESLGGGAGSNGGEIFLAVISARRARDDPRGRRRPRDLRVGRGRARPVEQRRAQGPRRLRARGGLGGEDRGGRDRRAGDRARDRGRRGVQRLGARRPCVLHRRERELPGPGARAVLAALQHGRRGDRDRHGRRRVGRAHPAERPGVAGRGRRPRRRRSAR